MDDPSTNTSAIDREVDNPDTDIAGTEVNKRVDDLAIDTGIADVKEEESTQAKA